ncbi:MAG: DMT family transporter [Rhodospirillales bacterium]|jgi:drug/metabolite transporter (DMT)-like permease|nr:DMT family transporter [Rhodospirillales bacterium]
MNAGFLGAITAIGWGGSDFIARFTGRGTDHFNALLGMLLSGAVFLTIYVYVTDMPIVWNWSSSWLIVGTGIGTMASTLLFYQSIIRGPISVVSPIVGGYPGFSVLFALAMGVRPSPEDWLATGVILTGVLTVARYSPVSNDPKHHDKSYNRKTVAIAVTASFLFAITILFGQQAVPIYGEVQTTWLARYISLASLLCLMFFNKSQKLNLPIKWWPLFCVQGIIDSTGYICLFAAGHLQNAEMAAVAASAFGAVTVLLARVFLKEVITLPQWAGIIAIFSGVGFLAM